MGRAAPMTGSEYQKVIAHLGLSQVGAAQFLGVNDTTSRRWVADKHPIPTAVSKLLRVMDHHDLRPDEVDAMKQRT